MRGLIASSVAVMSLTTPAPQFSTGVDAVRVDVLVTDGKRPVGGLRAADFELRDSGVIQRIDAVWFEDLPLSVMLALDASSSVRGEPLAHLKSAAHAVVSLLKGDDRAAVLTFSEEIDLFSDWTSDHQQLHRAIDSTRASGSTALHDAAYAALTLEDPRRGRPLVLIFSDGDDTFSWLPGQRVVDVARRGDAVVYGVSLHSSGARRPGHLLDFRSGLQPDVPRSGPSELAKPFLRALSEDTGGRSMDAVDSDRLRDAFVQVVHEFRSRYVLSYTPAGVADAGWHPLEVKLKGRKATIVARRGYSR